MVIENCNTATLLQEVATRLSSRTGNEDTISTDSTYSSTISEEGRQLTATCREHFAKILANISEKPNDISKIFSVTHFILVQSHACTPYLGNNKDWPCNFAYNSEVRGYQYRDRILELSVMRENNEKSDQEYHYISFSFLESKYAYHIEDIPVNWTPTFEAGKEKKDKVTMKYLFISIGQVFDYFCQKFVGSGKYTSKEYSLAGLKPLFSDSSKSSGEPSKKRKKGIPELPYDTMKFRAETPIFYTRLFDLFGKLDSKPTAHSRLFAMIHEILTFFCNCETTTKKGEWPGGPAYDSGVIQVWVPHSGDTDSELRYHIFHLSVLKNEKEFFCCFRFTDDHTKKCIRKVDKALIPSFTPSERERDAERIDNLNIWLSAIMKKFVEKVMVGSYSSRNTSISFISKESTVNSSVDCLSTGENE